MITESKDILNWIVEQGVRWQPSLGGTLSLGRTNSFFLGGGRSMLNALYLTAEGLGVAIAYEAELVDLEVDNRSEEHTSELQSPDHLVCRLLLEKKKKKKIKI